MGVFDQMSEMYETAKNSVTKTAQDLAAKGKTIRNVTPSQPAGVNMPKLAEEAAARALKGKPSTQQPAVKPKALPEYRKGGLVKATGPAKLHKGERVISAKQARAR